MTEPLMIGTRGWRHAPESDFYPPELPEDWRFCFYSNNLRSVLVPQESWESLQAAEVAQWHEDSDPEFRFVMELPALFGMPQTAQRREQALAQFLEMLAPVLPRTAGLLWRIATPIDTLPDWFEPFLDRLTELAPLCVDLPEQSWRTPEVDAALARQRAGRAWHCTRDAAPHPGGRLMIAYAPPAPAREVRHWIERLAQWQDADGQAGLFFETNAVRLAQEARLIAELMGV